MRGSAFPQGRACAMHMTERQSSCGPSQTACLCQSGRARGGRTSGVHGFHVPLPLACSGRHCMAVPETATGHELLHGQLHCAYGDVVFRHGGKGYPGAPTQWGCSAMRTSRPDPMQAIVLPPSTRYSFLPDLLYARERASSRQEQLGYWG